MHEITVGFALREHRTDGEPTLYGRIIHINVQADLVVIARFPGKNKKGQQKNYVPRPMQWNLSTLQKKVTAHEFSVVEFDTPSHWLLTSEQLRHNSTSGLQQASRRDLRKWLLSRASAYRLIRPFVHGRSIDEVLMDPDFAGWPAKRASELNLAGCSQIQRSLNAYLLALGLRNGLLPAYIHCGNPGKQKFSRTKTGRPTEFKDDGDPKLEGQNCDTAVRMIFAMGWKKFKKPGVSVRKAFQSTLNEWFCKSIKWQGVTAKVTLKPEALKFTEEQFEYWGKNNEGALSARAIERGETPARREYLRRQGNIKDRHLAANGEAFLDSTSCDQTLVSCASRLKVLSSPWRTDVMGAAVDYIFGHHVGFESPSATTALMAILHAAEDKVEYCAKFGIKIKPRDWLSMTFRQFIMDNGEGKGQLSMNTLEEMECGASFGAAYDAINKSPIESGHKRTQKHVDHGMPASTMGRRSRRGEPDRSVLARLNFYDYMPNLIEHVLFHNNKECITLPTIEMRRDGVEPTRRGVMEWMLATGYMTSAPTDLKVLRIHCLPRLEACLQADGLHLYDPTYSGKRIIPMLIFTSDWLMRSGMLDRASNHRWRLDAHLNPSDLSRVWVNLGGIKCLNLKTVDADMLQMTLLDWLSVSRDDRLEGFLAHVDKTKEGVNRVASIKQATKAANQERNAEIKAKGRKPTKAEQKRDKRDNTAAEKAAINGVPQPPKRKTVPSSRPPATAPIARTIVQPATDLNNIIRSLRQM
ncbi:hypothetical protein ABEW79_20120 [Delftia tsuruhatensis]|uniref:hypothetical protein n=1 Tax=Delftia tsuruhatensis TaxID=180282 RepID=UPI003D20471A